MRLRCAAASNSWMSFSGSSYVRNSAQTSVVDEAVAAALVASDVVRFAWFAGIIRNKPAATVAL